MSTQNFKNIKLAPFAVDTAVRFFDEAFQIEDVPKRMAIELCEESARTAKAMQAVINIWNPAAIVLSHKYYTNFGVPGGVALSNEIPVISLNNALIRVCHKLTDWYQDDFTLTTEVKSRLRSAIAAETAIMFAESRFQGLGRDMDSANGYTNKVALSKKAVTTELDLDPRKPIAVIMPHAFSDANHSDSWMVYDTYFEWFINILELTSSINEVNWVVRTHPSSHMYSEAGVGQSYAKKFPHVKLLRNDVQTSSVFGFADAVLTVRGTAGLEALYFGIQPILSGAAWYDSLPGVLSCRSESELISALKQISHRERLSTPDSVRSEQQIDAARALFYRFATHDYSAPSVGAERNPGKSESEVLEHDGKVLSDFVNAFQNPDAYWNDPYVQALVKFFENNDDRLSIIDIKACEQNAVVSA